MVEIELAITAVDFNHLLPVVEKNRTLVVLDQLELVGEPSTDHEFILAAGVVGTDLISYQPLVVSVDSDSLDETVDLSAFTKYLYFALAIEDRLLSIGAQIIELVLVDKEFR